MKQVSVWRLGVTLLPLLCPLIFGGCGQFMARVAPPRLGPARLGEETAATPILRSLPTPAEKVYAAVYKFRDLTGQYKLTEAGTNFSTAVTQGTTNILLKALEESNWFVPIERENVSNLLNERKIIRSSMAQYKNEADNLPPLLFAGIIMEGGVVSYDANVITGGAGLRYFGAGGSSQYRQDRVTVYLRAVATKTGKILKTIYTSKTILSQSVDGGLFRFVNFKRLLEAEMGFTSTEPAQLAVTEAIEKAVHSMVIEGIRDSLWTAAPREQGPTRVLLNAYAREQTDKQLLDELGTQTPLSPPRFVFQPYASVWQYQGDFANPIPKPGYGASLDSWLTPYVGLRLSAGRGQWGTRAGQPINLVQGSLHLVLKPFPFHAVSPLFQVGGGYLQRTSLLPDNRTSNRGAAFTLGTGLEYRMSQRFGLRATLDYVQPLTDALDGRVAGTRNDYYLQATAGLTVSFGRYTDRRLLKARRP